MSNLQLSLFDKLQDSYWLDNNRYFACYCPFDVHKTRALLVYEDGFICKSCGASGTLKYLENHVSDTPLRPTIQKSNVLPRWARWERNYIDIEGIAKVAHKSLTPDRAGYFRNRKIDQFINKGMFGLLDGWLTFPVFDADHKIIDIVVRNGGRKDKDVKYVLKPYKEKVIRPLYTPDWDKVLKSSRIIVCYGILDVWSFEAVGLPAVTGITGKTINPELFTNFQNKEFIIIPDEGEEPDAYRLAGQLGWRGSVHRVNYPYSVKDPDEYRRKLTADEWRLLVHNEWRLGEKHELV